MKKLKIIILILLFSACFVGCGKNPKEKDPNAISFDLTVSSGDWVKVPAGDFLSGMHGLKKTITSDYEIMKTEVTYAQYVSYLNKALAKNEIQVKDGFVVGSYHGDKFHGEKHEIEIKQGTYKYYNLSGVRCRIIFKENTFSVKPGYEIFPVAYVTWFGAYHYAKFHGWRLPSVLEWEKAARGTDGFPYPTGRDDITGLNANYYKSGDPFDSANGATPVGFYNGKTHGGFTTKDSPSPYGCYDMAGNVAEWIGDIIHGSHLRLIYGGSMLEYAYNLRSFTENSSVPEYSSYQVGFRCVRSSQ